MKFPIVIFLLLNICACTTTGAPDTSRCKSAKKLETLNDIKTYQECHNKGEY